MPASRARASDTIRILVSTDNHVGYNERDPVRGDDSWKTFDEIMTLAKDRDVDMVLLAGDLFHDNKPSRKAMYQVMRSLRANVYGDKPCELQMLSDSSEHFAGAFNHVNYDDENINVAIPVFSIHGNHDDPAGEGHLAALDILSMSGLLNYYGRTPEADNIEIKPVLLQKGQTKLALYGMSNVRDERLFRTFRDGHVRFFQPSTQTGDWFNIMSVHQNHHAYTETSYLPERFLPSFMDLIIWGHEHECKIDPVTNPEMGFKVMQPGSSVATSLVKGEAEPKHVAIVSVTGTNYDVETIRLKTVRPFVVREIVLKDYDVACKIAMLEDQDDRRARISHFLEGLINELIVEAQQSWQDLQEDAIDVDEDEPPPKPIVRLRVETTPPEGGTFNFDNPQRFSARFTDKVANALDVVQMHRKRAGVGTKKAQLDEPTLEAVTLDAVKVQELVDEYLAAQSLQVLPQNTFSDAVGQFVDKDDRHAMEEFLSESLKHQQKSLIGDEGAGEDEDEDEDELDEEKIHEQMEKTRVSLENAHASGELKRKPRKGTLKPKPRDWDSDEEGMSWADSMMSRVYEEDKSKKKSTRADDDEEEDEDDVSIASGARPARGRGSRGGRGGKAAGGTTRKAAAPKKAPAKTPAKGRKKQVSESEEEEDNDVIMLDDDSDGAESASALFMSQATQSRTQRSASPAKKPAARGATRGRGKDAATAAATRSSGTQQTLSFGTQANGTSRTSGRAAASKPAASRRHEPSEDEISDDDDAFEPPPAAQRTNRSVRR